MDKYREMIDEERKKVLYSEAENVIRTGMKLWFCLKAQEPIPKIQWFKSGAHIETHLMEGSWESGNIKKNEVDFAFFPLIIAEQDMKIQWDGLNLEYHVLALMRAEFKRRIAKALIMTKTVNNIEKLDESGNNKVTNCSTSELSHRTEVIEDIANFDIKTINIVNDQNKLAEELVSLDLPVVSLRIRQNLS
ncbi:hypothetical protein GLOIN_2v1646262 [Rhizophagus irregularis DAOM 181602=DAOM 197198]|nr:hypothetical protein GLOIN_2v1646262 [Rhizophagus irregularis DAOM 181602=DAOM 197198]